MYTSLSTQGKKPIKNIKTSKKVQEMVIFSMLATLMFCSKIIMEALPNIHLLGMLTMLYTVVFRFKALIPIYIYVLINGIYSGFSLWWVPYTYVWTVLWAITMLVPKKTPKNNSSVHFACHLLHTRSCIRNLIRSCSGIYVPYEF